VAARPHGLHRGAREIRDVDVHTRDAYSRKTRLYWTWETGIGVGFSLTALMAIVVGMVVVGQTIYSATVEHLREFGTLKAIGAANRDVYRIVIEQALINAVLGYALGLAITQVVIRGFGLTGLVMIVPAALVVAVFGITLVMCLSASVISVRKAVSVDPLVVFKA
jgi:putative ABC transport system permease protein